MPKIRKVLLNLKTKKVKINFLLQKMKSTILILLFLKSKRVLRTGKYCIWYASAVSPQRPDTAVLRPFRLFDASIRGVYILSTMIHSILDESVIVQSLIVISTYKIRPIIPGNLVCTKMAYREQSYTLQNEAYYWQKNKNYFYNICI